MRPMRIFRQGLGPHQLAVAMAGVKMGERLLVLGAGTPAMTAAIAAKVGLSGRACAVVFNAEEQQAVERAAAREGVLVEVAVTGTGTLPFEEGAFDVAVIDSTGGLLASMDPAVRAAWLAEARRVLRDGGRGVVIEAGARGRRGATADGTDRQPAGSAADLAAVGFRPVRLLAEREGRRFTEGMKPRA